MNLQVLVQHPTMQRVSSLMWLRILQVHSSVELLKSFLIETRVLWLESFFSAAAYSLTMTKP